MLSKAIRISECGGPAQMTLGSIEVGEPGPGEIRVHHHAVGVNFIDVYYRTGLYPLQLPATLGMEAAGVVEAVGEGVAHLKVGDRVAYACQPPGAYCEWRVMSAKFVCRLPDSISFETGAAMMLKGLTAQYLLKRSQPQGGLQPGDFVLFHAIAGGVGLIAAQWAKALGLQLIGTAGSAQKCELARVRRQPRHQLPRRKLPEEGGGHHRGPRRSGGLRLYRQGHLGSVARLPVAVRPDGEFRQRLRAGPALFAFDSGGQRFDLRHPPDPVHAHQVARSDAGDGRRSVRGVESGQVKIRVDQRYPLENVQQAHENLEARKTTGCTILTV